MEELRKVANNSFNQGDYLQSALVIIQMVEGLLRMEINWFALINNIPERVIKRASVEEQSFYRLVVYLDLVKPDNDLSERLIKFNSDRNKIIHRLFYEFESFASLKKHLVKFCKEGLNLFHNLLGLSKRVNKKRQ